MAPLGGRGALGPAQTLDERLVVRDGDGHIDQSVTKSWDHRDVARRDGGVQLECQLVPPRRVTAQRKMHRLAAVVPETELAEDLERRLVVAEVRSAEARRLEAGAREQLHSPTDGVALPLAVHRGVIAVDEAVHRDLRASRGESLEHLRVPGEDARRRRPGRPDAELGRERVVALEALHHRSGGGPEAGEHLRRACRRTGGATSAQAHREAHARSAPSTATGTDRRNVFAAARCSTSST